jgi:cardiolipin synthase
MTDHRRGAGPGKSRGLARSRAGVAILAVLATLLVVWLGANLATGEKKVTHRIEHLYGVEDPRFLGTMGVLLGPQVTRGNRFHALLNGDQIFPAMLTAIRGARKTIDFETYIYWSGDIGRAFADAFAERARAGVAVHVMLDWVGTAKMDEALIRELQQAGVEVERYHKPSWTGLGKLNNRTHRKLLVIDGTVGFTGGVGIAPQWTGHAQDPDHWRDSYFQVEGPVVAQMQAVFMDNWMKTTGAVLYADAYFPDMKAEGDGIAQVFMSSSNGGSASMELMYLLAVTAAEHTIRLSSSYFVPNDVAIGSFIEAMHRGVKVQIITPGPYIDSETVRKASRAKWGPLLEAGAEIYEYQPTMYHVKAMIVDDYMVSVGSTNFDDRSFRLNDEANLNMYDAGFAREQVAIFDEDRAHARSVTFDQWQNRPWSEKALERLATVFDSQL